MHQKSGWVEVKVGGSGESSSPNWETNRPVFNESALSALLDRFHFTLDVPVDHWTVHFNSRPLVADPSTSDGPVTFGPSTSLTLKLSAFTPTPKFHSEIDETQADAHLESLFNILFIMCILRKALSYLLRTSVIIFWVQSLILKVV